MTTKSITRETDIAAAVVKHMTGYVGYKVRQEVLVILDGTTVSLDILANIVHPPGEFFVACEVKRTLSYEVIEQARRWLGKANQVMVAIAEPGMRTKAHNARRFALKGLGIGLFYVNGEVPSLVETAEFNNEADTRLLSAVFHGSTGEIDPPAGSSSAKRATGERCQWEPLRKYLESRESFVAETTWKEIQQNVPEMLAHTAAAARKAIIRGECVGVGYLGKGITTFYAVNGERTQ